MTVVGEVMSTKLVLFIYFFFVFKTIQLFYNQPPTTNHQPFKLREYQMRSIAAYVHLRS